MTIFTASGRSSSRPKEDVTHAAAHRWATSTSAPGTSQVVGFNGNDTNLFRYVGNAPTNATDPSGLQAEAHQPIEAPPPRDRDVLDLIGAIGIPAGKIQSPPSRDRQFDQFVNDTNATDPSRLQAEAHEPIEAPPPRYREALRRILERLLQPGADEKSLEKIQHQIFDGVGLDRLPCDQQPMLGKFDPEKKKK